MCGSEPAAPTQAIIAQIERTWWANEDYAGFASAFNLDDPIGANAVHHLLTYGLIINVLTLLAQRDSQWEPVTAYFNELRTFGDKWAGLLPLYEPTAALSIDLLAADTPAAKSQWGNRFLHLAGVTTADDVINEAAATFYLRLFDNYYDWLSRWNWRA